TASADAGWVKIAPSAITQGGRVVQFTVEANPGDPRKATLRIAGVEIAITQATASPFIASVLNGGSLAASPLSPGARFALVGVNLAGATVAAPADRWPVSLGGVRVTLDGVDAPLGLVSPERIVGQVPWSVKVGDVPLTLQVGDAPVRAASVTVREAAPGLFSAEAGKTLALNEDGTQNLRVNPAATGSLITVFLTGQGPVDAAVEDGAGATADPAVKPVLPVAASIGDRTAEVASAELAPGQVGVLRVGLRVPEVADGERPIIVTIGGATSNTGAIYVGQQNCVPKPEGLKSFWPADGTTEDVAGGLSATLQNGASYAPGFVGEAFSLDGIDDYVWVPDAPGLNPVAAVSVEAWIYRSAAVGLNDPVVKKAYTASTVRGGYTLEFTGNSIGFWAFTESKGWSRSALGPVPFGAWTHVVGVHDGSALRVYIDGRAAGAPVAAPGPLVPSSNPLTIGWDPVNPGRFFRGLIDEVGIYGRALSEAEIQVLYVRGARGKCRN
ncbi:MAG: BACON domain-containing carbohydrate-binding protein, partial [Acidobacteria bacterium]|nr:BACON domain-containing carbohydrate-binding protein [Acidobacteriota bacterium]